MICKFCRDKEKYGGGGKLKQCCEKKKCTKETTSKIPRIFQQPTSRIPGKWLLCMCNAMFNRPIHEPASIKDIPQNMQTDIVSHKQLILSRYITSTYWT